VKKGNPKNFFFSMIKTHLETHNFSFFILFQLSSWVWDTMVMVTDGPILGMEEVMEEVMEEDMVVGMEEDMVVGMEEVMEEVIVAIIHIMVMAVMVAMGGGMDVMVDMEEAIGWMTTTTRTRNRILPTNPTRGVVIDVLPTNPTGAVLTNAIGG